MNYVITEYYNLIMQINYLLLRKFSQRDTRFILIISRRCYLSFLVCSYLCCPAPILGLCWCHIRFFFCIPVLRSCNHVYYYCIVKKILINIPANSAKRSPSVIRNYSDKFSFNMANVPYFAGIRACNAFTEGPIYIVIEYVRK